MTFQAQVDALESLVKSIESNAQRTGVVEKMGMCPIWAGIEDDTGKLAKFADQWLCPITAHEARSLLTVADMVIPLLDKEVAYWKPKVFPVELKWKLDVKGIKEEYRKTQLYLFALQDSREAGLRTWKRMRNNAEQIVKRHEQQQSKPSMSASAQIGNTAVAYAGTNPPDAGRRGRATSRTSSDGNKPSPSPSPHRPASARPHGSTSFEGRAQTRSPPLAKPSGHGRRRSRSPQREAQDPDRMPRGYH